MKENVSFLTSNFKIRKIFNLKINVLYIEFVDEKSFNKFRMDLATFFKLCEDLRPLLFKKDTKFRKAITVNKRVAIGLYFLKSGVDFSVLADVFCIGKSTAQKIVQEFLDAVAQKYKGLIKFPTEEEKIVIAESYERKWQFYNCFGALDGCHIPVLPPQANAKEYYCYKGFHSINALALCDDKCFFR